MQRKPMSRRELLAAISALGVAGALGLPESALAAGPKRPMPKTDILARAAATAPAGSDLGAIDHVVFLMMENRSYDHYFGAYPKGRGFDDHPKHSLGNFAQVYPGATGLTPPNVLLPFHLERSAGEECTDDLTHDWGPMHECWDHGKMDHFVKVHTSSQHEGARGAMTMGYYTRKELPFYYGIADNFTLCDNYHASVIGPTHPNRLYANTGMIDPTGAHGGPICSTDPNPTRLWSCTWPTVQELLEEKNIPWKVYHPSTVGAASKYSFLNQFPIWNEALYNPLTNAEVMFLTDTVLPYFKNFELPTSPLHQKAFVPTFPANFTADVANDTLPSVSWLIPPLGFDEHPSSMPDRGMWFTEQVLEILMSNPKVWAKTVFFLMYDENDGWFDHVSPPVPPAGTPGETVTGKPAVYADTDNFTHPIGMGVRVPMLVMSPFSRGGHIASEVLDHTSQLRFLEERFGIRVDNITEWRRKTAGDLTSTLKLGKRDMSMPALPKAPTPVFEMSGGCEEVEEEGEVGGVDPTVPTKQQMPTQNGKLLDPASFGLTGKASKGAKPPAVRTAAHKATIKSSAMAHPSVTGSSASTLPKTGGLPDAIPAVALLGAGIAGAVAARKLGDHDEADVD